MNERSEHPPSFRLRSSVLLSADLLFKVSHAAHHAESRYWFYVIGSQGHAFVKVSIGEWPVRNELGFTPGRLQHKSSCE